MHERPERPPVRWPTSVRPVVQARVDRLAREATGRVVDLGVDHGFRFPLASSICTADGAVDAGADHVVSVGALAASSDLTGLLARVLGWLDVGGRLLFLEPVIDPAPRRLRRRSAASPPNPPVQPRDVTWELWEHGFAVTTVDRVRLDRSAAPLDHWAFGVAQRRRMPRPTEALIADGRGRTGEP